MMTLKIPLELVQKVIKKRVEQADLEIARETELADLAMDSFTMLEIVFDLEEALGTEIAFNAHDPQIEELKTVGQLLDYLDSTS